MLGKIAAAVVGDRIAGRNKGAKGAVLGIVAATALKRAIPTIAAAAILGYAYKKAKNFLEENEPDYPSEATPSPPPG